MTRTRYVAPLFPPDASRRGIDGWVDLQFLVNTDGSVGELTIVGAQPVGIFEQAAPRALRPRPHPPPPPHRPAGSPPAPGRPRLVPPHRRVVAGGHRTQRPPVPKCGP